MLPSKNLALDLACSFVEFSKAAGILVLAEAVGSVPPAHRRSNAFSELIRRLRGAF